MKNYILTTFVIACCFLTSCYSKELLKIPIRTYFPVTNLTSLNNSERRTIRNIYSSVKPVFNIKHVKDDQASTLDDFTGLVERHKGYSTEEHAVYSDGYKLVLHRLRNNSTYSDEEIKPVVYIQHGLFMSSDCFVLLGPGRDLAFILADAGFDVWIGNTRGNSYSRSHSNLSPNDTNFWDFSLHEIGTDDISVIMYYILLKTRAEKLDFIGYQLGATEGFIYLSEKKLSQEQIRLFIAINPLVYWKDAPEEDVTFNTVSYIRSKLNEINESELYPQSSFYEALAWARDTKDRVSYEIIKSFYGTIDVFINETALLRIMQHFPAGTSKKVVQHLLQIIESGRFAKYDSNYDKHKTMDNLSKTYNMSNIEVPVVIFKNRLLARFINFLDFNRLEAEIPNLVSNAFYGHVGNLWPKISIPDYYEYLTDLLKNY